MSGILNVRSLQPPMKATLRVLAVVGVLLSLLLFRAAPGYCRCIVALFFGCLFLFAHGASESLPVCGHAVVHDNTVE